MTTLQDDTTMNRDVILASTASARPEPKTTRLTAGEHLPPHPATQTVPTLEKAKSELAFQKGSLSAHSLFEKGLISREEMNNIISYFSSAFHPDIEELIKLDY